VRTDEDDGRRDVLPVHGEPGASRCRSNLVPYFEGTYGGTHRYRRLQPREPNMIGT